MWDDGVGLGEIFDKIKTLITDMTRGYCIADPTYKNAPLALIKM